MQGRKVSWELIGALVVVLGAICGGSYFHVQGEREITVVCAAKDIAVGGTIAAADLKLTTFKRREIPEFLKSPADYQSLETKSSSESTASKTGYATECVYASSLEKVIGFHATSNIYKDQILYNGNLDRLGNFQGIAPIGRKPRAPLFVK